MYTIRILNSEPCWVSEEEQGDPPRTLLINNAQTFKSKKEAWKRIVNILKTHPLKKMSYKIEEKSS